MKSITRWRTSTVKDRVMIGIRCTEEMRDRLKELAKESRRSLNEYVVYILERSIKEQDAGK